MNALSQPYDPLIEQAMADARTWCRGHIIDDRRRWHTRSRSRTNSTSTYPASCNWSAPRWFTHRSPLFAPGSFDLDTYLTGNYGPEVTRIVRAMQAQHEALDSDNPPVLVDDVPVLLTSTADKIVALTSLLRRARLSGDVQGFFRVRQPLLRILPYFRAYQRAGAALIPPRMAADLAAALEQLEQATAGCKFDDAGHAGIAGYRSGGVAIARTVEGRYIIESV